MMLAYVTGAAGFVGSHLTDRLIRDGYRVVDEDFVVHPDEIWRDRLQARRSEIEIELHAAEEIEDSRVA